MGADPGAADLVPRLVGFARLLHDLGLDAQARVTVAAQAASELDVARETDVRAGLKAVFVSNPEHRAIFEAAFDLYWRRPPAAAALQGRTHVSRRLSPADAERWAAELGFGESVEIERRQLQRGRGYSAQEVLRRRDFQLLSPEEAAEVRRLLLAAPWQAALRRSRRRAAARHGRVDMRRTALASARSQGELLRLLHWRRRLRPRPLVLLCDVSGSMESYSRQLLLFAHALARRDPVEIFVFATRLSRVTRLLREREPDRALQQFAAHVPDYSGGTRIGEALHEFNRKWARRVFARGAVVVIISDGWDRGDAHLLGAELRHLRRLTHRLIWLNPLLGSSQYRPLTRGMAAALPHVDDFLAAHNLAALDALAHLLAEPGRPARRPHGRTRV